MRYCSPAPQIWAPWQTRWPPSSAGSPTTNSQIISSMLYPTGLNVKYVDQLLIRIDTCAGDSGSVYLDNDDNVVGLHAGGAIINGQRYAVANKIKNVTALLGLSLH